MHIFVKTTFSFQVNMDSEKSHSTDYSGLEVVGKIIEQMDKGYMPVNYLYLSKAFDTIDHHILLKKICFCGVHVKSITSNL